MGVDFRQQALSRITCRTSIASDMPCGAMRPVRPERRNWHAVARPGAGGARAGRQGRGNARQGAKVVQDRAARLVRVRVAPQRSAPVRQRAPAVHGRRPFVHALCATIDPARAAELAHVDHAACMTRRACRGSRLRKRRRSKGYSGRWQRCWGGGVGWRCVTISRPDRKTAGAVWRRPS